MNSPIQDFSQPYTGRQRPAMVTGQYGSIATFWGSSVRYNRTVSGVFAADTIYSWQIPVWQDVTILSLAIAIRANAGGADKKFCIGIAKDNRGSDTGILLGSTGVVTVASGASIGDAGVPTVVSIPLHPGMYWVRFVTDTARHATNWDLDVCQQSLSTANPGEGCAQGWENTASFSATSQNNFPPRCTEARAWNDSIPLPAQSAGALVYGTSYSPMLSIKLGW